MEPKSACELLQHYKDERPGLSFGCRLLDDAIGCLPICGINEISGEAGSGKTQFCLSFSLQCQLPITSGGLNGSCAYITSGEGEFPIRRLSQLQSSPAFRDCTLERVFIEQCFSPEDMITILRTKIPEMCEKKYIKLLIIDSLAGLIRHEYEQDIKDMKSRTTFLFRFASALKWLADIHKVCILVVNQVTSTGFESTNSISCGSFFHLKPALGLAWTTCVNTRIMLYRDSSNTRACEFPCTTNQINTEGKQVNVDSVQTGIENGNHNQLPSNRNQLAAQVESTNKIKYLNRSRRFISLQFSPIRPREICEYEITVGGIKGVVSSVNRYYHVKHTTTSLGSSSSLSAGLSCR